MLPTAHGRHHGKAFETLLGHQAAISGLLVTWHGTQLRYLKGGKHLAIKSDLDCRIVTRQGQVVFADLKSFIGETFPYSAITSHQLIRAREYEAWGLKAGFVVHLRGAKRVVWYRAKALMDRGPGSSFGVAHGLDLGPDHFFALTLLFA